ncbi:bifunctional riboflavin kinase/FAD synthetase [Marinomonas agarivorans]|nr:bifunctional riboflavin kinase/FAD synthetase [Marinomonas agarivorans]
MEFIRGVHNIQSKHKRCVLTIGNFDGVHLGHQTILQRVKKLASQYEAASCIMIFEPQPREYFAADQAPRRVTRLRDKLFYLANYGIDYVLCLPFNERLQKLTAQEFCQTVLANGLDVQHLVVGDDFHFGCDRQGNFDYLLQFGNANQFIVEHTKTVLSENSQRVSSSLVRDALTQGDIIKAESLLGHEVRISGRVVHGKKLGRELGFPTANVHLKGIASALAGVFAIKLCFNGKEYEGVANVGIKPTVGGHQPTLEVHLFEFSGSLYNQYVDVYFCFFIRPEKKMSGLPELKKQIKNDKQEAQCFFAKQTNAIQTNDCL